MDIQQKSPEERLDFDVDFSPFLTDGDYLLDVSAIATATDVLVDATQISPDSLVAKIWLSGGQPGTSGDVRITASTFLGRIVSHPFRLRIKSASGC